MSPTLPCTTSRRACVRRPSRAIALARMARHSAKLDVVTPALAPVTRTFFPTMLAPVPVASTRWPRIATIPRIASGATIRMVVLPWACRATRQFATHQNQLPNRRASQLVNRRANHRLNQHANRLGNQPRSRRVNQPRSRRANRRANHRASRRANRRANHRRRRHRNRRANRRRHRRRSASTCP